MDDFLGFLVVMGVVLAGGAWVVINFWPVLLILAFVGVGVAIAVNYEPPPDPQREIRQAEEEAKRAIDSAGKNYRKRVNDLTK